MFHRVLNTPLQTKEKGEKIYQIHLRQWETSKYDPWPSSRVKLVVVGNSQIRNCNSIIHNFLIEFSSVSIFRNLRILTGKKHRQIKLQRLQKVQIWAFGVLVQQINSLKEVLKLKQNVQKNKAVTDQNSSLCDRSIL